VGRTMAALNATSGKALLESKRYDPEILPQLETYVDAQCKGRTYDLDCNLATLKLYQFHPDKSNAAVIAKILIKALMNLPHSDYLLCTYLVPESVQELEQIAAIFSVASLLEACQFRAFWSALEPLRELLASIPGFDDAIREFMLGTLQITYQAVPLAHVTESLGLSNASALQPLVSSKGWAVEGDMVRISLNDDNTAKPKKVDVSGSMGNDQMTKILSSIAS